MQHEQLNRPCCTSWYTVIGSPSDPVASTYTDSEDKARRARSVHCSLSGSAPLPTALIARIRRRSVYPCRSFAYGIEGSTLLPLELQVYACKPIVIIPVRWYNSDGFLPGPEHRRISMEYDYNPSCYWCKLKGYACGCTPATRSTPPPSQKPPKEEDKGDDKGKKK